MNDKPAIRLDRISKRFAGSNVDAVRELSLDIPRGSIVALIGPSGCGKTTTLRMINRLTEPTGGRIEIDGEDVSLKPATDLRRGIGYVIQQVGLFPHRTVSENIATVPKVLGWNRTRIDERVLELSNLVSLDPDMLSRYPDELSGGQQQRVGVARALAADPPVLLMDEPFGAVDPIVRGRLQDELLTLQARLHKTIVLVTHDLDEAIRVADRIALLDLGGTLEQYAPADEILRAPANEFVEKFVGEDRGLMRLGLHLVSELPFDRGPILDAGALPAEIASTLQAQQSDWFGLTRDHEFLGWAHRSALDETNSVDLADLPLALPAAQVTPNSTLRGAMEVIMTSDTSVAVINDAGRFGGVVTLEAIRASLAAQDEA